MGWLVGQLAGCMVGQVDGGLVGWEWLEKKCLTLTTYNFRYQMQPLT